MRGGGVTRVPDGERGTARSRIYIFLRRRMRGGVARMSGDLDASSLLRRFQSDGYEATWWFLARGPPA